jgi:UDP-glucuronate decarboxylase
VLVTGASGFIGRWTIPELLARGFEVHCTSQRSVGSVPTGARVHNIDLLDEEETRALVAQVRPSHLMHFAWNAAPGIYWTTPDNLSWVAASLKLLQAFHRAGGVRAVFAGSCAEYDWSRAGICVENSTPDVLSEGSGSAKLYPVCKAALNRMVTSYALQEQLSVAWGRIFFQYGPYENPQRLVPSVILSLLQGREAPCTRGYQKRSFMYVADVGAAFVSLLESDVRGNVNIGSDNIVSIAELTSQVAEIIGRPDLLKLGARPDPVGEPPLLVPNAKRLRSEVGFSARQSLQSGLELTIDWWSNHLRHGRAG